MIKKIPIVLLVVTAYACNYTGDPEISENLLVQARAEAAPVFIKASADINNLRIEVAEAKKKVLSKKVVVMHFNNLVGPYIGHQSSFDVVDKKLKSSGNDYIKIMFDRECSRIALEKTAQCDY